MVSYRLVMKEDHIEHRLKIFNGGNKTNSDGSRTVHKYVERIKTATGWNYIYPEDLEKQKNKVGGRVKDAAKEIVNSVKNEAGKAAGETIGKIKSAAGDTAEKTSNFISQFSGNAGKAIDSAKKEIKSVVKDVKKEAKPVVKDIENGMKSLKKEISGKTSDIKNFIEDFTLDEKPPKSNSEKITSFIEKIMTQP